MSFEVIVKKGEKIIKRIKKRTRTGADAAKWILEKENEGATVEVKGGVFN